MKIMDIKEITDRIAFFRNKANLSARELSLMLGKHDSYINKLESNDFVISMPAFLEILNTLQITPQEFFAPNYKTYEKDVLLENLVNNLSSKKRELLIRFINEP